MDKIYLAKEVFWDEVRMISAHRTKEGAQKAADSDMLYEQKKDEEARKKASETILALWKNNPFPQGRVWTVTEMELKD